jgi:hypothetical protein
MQRICAREGLLIEKSATLEIKLKLGWREHLPGKRDLGRRQKEF